MEALSLVFLAALVVKITSFLKFVTSGTWGDARTQAIAWLAGVAVAFLAANADVTAGLTVFGTYTLGKLDSASLVLFGISVASGGSFAYDYKAARDGSDSAREPSMFG